jgi:hypothetical protein
LSGAFIWAQAASGGRTLEYLRERQFQNHHARRIPYPERVRIGITAPAQSLSPDLSRRLEGFQVRRIGIAKLNAVLGFMKLLTIEVIEKEQRNGDPPSKLSNPQRCPPRGVRSSAQVNLHLIRFH